jgi:hypothetical protein
VPAPEAETAVIFALSIGPIKSTSRAGSPSSDKVRKGA